MAIVFSEKTQEIHIFNRWISYIIQIMDNGELSNLYFGKRIGHKDDFSYLWKVDSVHWQYIQKKMIIL